MKVVINNCFGGFGLSPEATLELWKRGGPVEATPVAEAFRLEREPSSPFSKEKALEQWRAYLAAPDRRHSIFLSVFTPDESMVLYARDVSRSDPKLVQLVEEMGEAVNGQCSDLKVVEIPDDVEWEISEYDGNEHVAEKHRVWS